MLPATTRKQLRIPHHVAMLCAGICLATAFYVDIQHQQVVTKATVEKPTATSSTQKIEARPTKPTRFDLPRLFPWAPNKPTSE